jgi:hypothetical protein
MANASLKGAVKTEAATGIAVNACSKARRDALGVMLLVDTSSASCGRREERADAVRSLIPARFAPPSPLASQRAKPLK